MDCTLVIMAAGIGSRFGGGIKQLEPVGPKGQIIMDYSIHDALDAGFNKIVFIIRKDLEKDFKEIIGNRIEKLCSVEYAFQEINDLPKGFKVPEDRKKPWGTGQAILCCKNIVKEPFAIINADDYYGKEAFKNVYKFLSEKQENKAEYNFCMSGFVLKNTLSENGTVCRGICKVDDEGYLLKVDETDGIVKVGSDKAGVQKDGEIEPIDENSPVSMNMWGITPDFFNVLEKEFPVFLSSIKEGDIKAEFLLPKIIDNMLKEGKASVKVIKTEDKWFGVTYKEDKDFVVNSFKDLIAKGEYTEDLF